MTKEMSGKLPVFYQNSTVLLHNIILNIIYLKAKEWETQFNKY